MYKNRSGKFTNFFFIQNIRNVIGKKFFLRRFLSLSFPFLFHLAEYGSGMNQHKAG